MEYDHKITSAEQDAWVAIWSQTRAELSKMVTLIPAMQTDEIKTLVESMQVCMWAHFQAETFDKKMELELERIIPPDSSY